MISSLAVTQQQGLLGAFLFMVPSAMLSGFATPIANMPLFVQHLTLLNPLRCFLVPQQQGLLGAFLFMVPSAMLSGFATPIANMPLFVQHLTLLNPLRCFLVIIRGVFLQGTPFHMLASQFWPMAVIGLVNLTIAGFLFRRRLY